MNKNSLIFCVTGVLAIGSVGAATIYDGAALGAWADGSADGWSGVTVLESSNGTIAAADSGGQPAFNVTSASFWVSPGRDTDEWNVIPIVVDPSNNIIWTGSTLTPTGSGLNTFAFDSGPIEHGGLDHRIGFYQWKTGVDNVDGGTVAFAAGGGEGMFQSDVDGTVGAGAIAVGMNLVAGHGSPAGGRDYYYENEVSFGAIPEPGVAGLIGLTGLAVLCLRRRR
ncbi:MAG: hypothetical protein P8J87_04180 [Verrucomicrobiales bacterium]|nr:hypothetical protein [Verrucomicrobiales bacterium]